tara:strand:- start:1012 stop:2496 length:1485 start_codon:yes stop_codon:yes gene_type:complete
MSNQGTIRLKVTNGAPAIEKLWNGRFKLEFLCDNNSPKEDWYYDNISSILPDYGILQDTNFGSGVSEDWEAIPDSVYPDMRLVETEYAYIPSMGDKRVKLTYETLTAAWVEEKAEDTDYELNGLKRVSRTFVALPDTAYDKVVGTSTIDSDGTTLYLGSFKIEKTEAKWELTEVWLEAGVLSRSIQTRSNGKLILETVEALVETPVAETVGAVQIGNDVSNVEGIQTKRFTFAKGAGQISVDSRPAPAQLAGCTYVTVRSLGTPVTPTGVIVAESETESDGYITYEKTALQGTIVGTKQTYKDVVEVTDAGIVNCTQVSKAAGGINGTIAVTQVTPPRTKTLAATVTVEVTTSPPNTAALAYDLGDISCSVTSISMSENFRGTDVFTTESGNSRYSGQRKAADMSARISTYPNCYLSSSSGTGTFSYISSYQNDSTNPNSIVATAQNSTTKTFTDGTGSTSAAYATAGVVRRNSRPILTALNGTVYFEVVTWTI